MDRVELGVGVGLAHVLHRHADLEVELLTKTGVDDRALAGGADQEAPDLLERPLGGGQPDALERALRQVLEALERQRQVRAALRLRDRVHLVHDHPLGILENLARARGKH